MLAAAGLIAGGLWLAVKYWFRIPVAGTAIATALFALSLLG